ncbi:MAG: ATP-binding protein [Candidatus Thermoplasmatota archaeon]|nr:ATP-binding protein [Candidatus Thermoplasmatota archaeon]
MTDIATLRDIIHDGKLQLIKSENLAEREIGEKLHSRRDLEVIEVATGVRRSGKSKLLLMVGRKMMAEGRSVHYINFEDDRFVFEDRDPENISSLLDLEGSVLLLDEVQNMPKWERWVRRMHDRGVKIYLTGSNSKLLGGELSTALGGRRKEHGVFPFSFKEYLRAKDVKIGATDQLVRALDDYMIGGGFPYPVISGDRDIIAEYRNDIVEKDILLRYRIRNVGEFRDLYRFLLSNPGLYVSERSIKGFIRISHVTLRKYLYYMEQAYTIILLEKYGRSRKEQLQNPKKVYPIDNGLLLRTKDRGRLLESCIAQHLRRITDDIHYWKDDRAREVDFILPDRKLAIQVVYELNGENIKREEAPLRCASEVLGMEPLIVFMYSNVETKMPSMRATDFIENMNEMISDG